MSTTSQARLYRMETEQHICPYGLKAKDLLKRRGFDVEDHTLNSREETETFKREHGVDTTPQVFIDGERIGGYEDLRVYLGEEAANDAAGGASYQPVIAVFAVTFLMAVAAIWARGAPAPMALVELFVAFSMCVLAILKLRDLEAFSIQFITYDLLARRVVRYAYVYPFAEAFVGIGMIAGLAVWLVAPVALFVGTVGAASVCKAVYIDKRELKCACVGGDSKVPLGFVSLTENLMMVLMGVWMLVR